MNIAKIVTVAFIGWALAPGSRAIAKDLVVFDDFSRSSNWENVDWGDQALMKVGSDKVSHGKQALAISFSPEGKKPERKGVVIRRPLNGKASDIGRVVFDVYNEISVGKISVSIGFDIDSYYESKEIELKKGWNKDISFNVTQNTFKSHSTGWANTGFLPKDLTTSMIYMLFYRDGADNGLLYLDNIRTEIALVTKEKKTLLKKPKPLVEVKIPKIKAVSGAVKSLQKYDILNLTVKLDGYYTNPFNSEEIQLSADLVAPDGSKKTVLGYFENGNLDSGKTGDHIWKVKFTPSIPGSWSYQVRVKNSKGEGKSQIYTVKVEDNKRAGFVRVDKKNPHYFAFDSGEFYYALGENVGWGTIEEYRNIFSRLQASKATWGRVWMSSWNVALEGVEGGHFRGLHQYNLVNAQKLDEIFDLATKSGIYLQLVFDPHGHYSTKVNPDWSKNPYNSANGGPLRSPSEFFTNEVAKKLYKERLRYIIARWGHNVSLLAWELFNEINFTDDFDEKIDAAWHREMSEYIKSIDPYSHLVSTSYSGGGHDGTWTLESIDFTQYHTYMRRVDLAMKNESRRMKKYNKPFLFAEFGSDSESGGDEADKKGIFLHSGIWTMAMLPSAGNAMPWWWDSHIEKYDLYFHFKALASFLEGIDRRQHDFKYFQTGVIGKSGNEDVIFRLMGQADRQLGIYFIRDSLGMHMADRPAPLDFKDVVFNLRQICDAPHQIEFWDTYKGTIINTVDVKPNDGFVEVALPPFKNDMAFKIKCEPGTVSR